MLWHAFPFLGHFFFIFFIGFSLLYSSFCLVVSSFADGGKVHLRTGVKLWTGKRKAGRETLNTRHLPAALTPHATPKLLVVSSYFSFKIFYLHLPIYHTHVSVILIGSSGDAFKCWESGSLGFGAMLQRR
jgi:hypothetical protein